MWWFEKRDMTQEFLPLFTRSTDIFKQYNLFYYLTFIIYHFLPLSLITFGAQ